MDGLKARLSFDAVAYDYDDEYLTIDTDTHIININNLSRLFGVQYDGNSKLIKFRISNKLSDIQKMQDSIVYINWIDSKGVKGQSIAIDKTISNDICEFAWKVPFDALKNSRVLHFAMSAVITENSSSVIDQKWSTQIASVIIPDGIYIKSYTPSSEEEDRIAQIYNELSRMINKQNDDLKADIDVERKRIDVLNDGGLIIKDELIENIIKTWLVEHPEATTTVQDGSITENKLHTELLDKLNNSYNAISLQKKVNKHSKLYFSEQALVYGDYTNTVNKCVDAGIKNAHIYVALNYDEESGTLVPDNEISNLDQYYAFCKSKGIVQDVLKIHTNESTKKLLSENETLRTKYINKVNELIEHFNVDKNLKIVYILNECEVVTLKTRFDDFVKSVIDAIHTKNLKAGISFSGEANAYYFTRNLPLSYDSMDIIGINAYPAIHSGEYASIQDSINVWDGYMLYMEKVKQDGKLLAITETGLCPAWRNLRVPYHWENPMLSGNKIDEFVLQLYLYGLFNNNRINTMCDSICLWFAEYIPYMDSVIKFIKLTYIGG